MKRSPKRAIHTNIGHRPMFRNEINESALSGRNNKFNIISRWLNNYRSLNITTIDFRRYYLTLIPGSKKTM